MEKRGISATTLSLDLFLDEVDGVRGDPQGSGNENRGVYGLVSLLVLRFEILLAGAGSSSEHLCEN